MLLFTLYNTNDKHQLCSLDSHQATTIMMSLKFAAIALLACLFVAAAFAQGQQRRPGGGGGGGGGSVGGGGDPYGDLSEFQSTHTELSPLPSRVWLTVR